MPNHGSAALLLAFRPISLVSRCGGLKVCIPPHIKPPLSPLFLIRIDSHKANQFHVLMHSSFQIVIVAIARQSLTLSKTVLICGAFWIIFAIMGVQLFAGKFYKVSLDQEANFSQIFHIKINIVCCSA